MKKLLFLLLLTGNYLLAQQGYYYQKLYQPVKDNRNLTTYDLIQDEIGSMLITNQLGLLVFNGQSSEGGDWDIIETEFPVFHLEAVQGQIYGAGNKSFGPLTKNHYGTYEYNALPDNDSLFDNTIQNLVSLDGYVAIICSQDIVLYDVNEKSFRKINTEEPVDLGFASAEGLVIQTRRGRYLLSENQLVALPSERNIKVTAKMGNRHVIADENDSLFILEGNTFTLLALEDDGYTAASDITSLAAVNDSLLVAGTLLGGVVLINPTNGKVDQIINYHTGLPDNDVQHLFVDRDKGIWVGHNNGYSRIVPNLPFHSYNYYPGLDGTLITTNSIDGTLYVGTNLGLFYLDKVENYNEIVFYVRNNPKTKLDVEEKSEGIFSFMRRDERQKVEEEPSAGEEEQSGFLNRLFRKDSREEEEKGEDDSGAVQRIVQNVTRSAATQEQVTYQRKTRKELQSIDYIYRKVENINGEVSQIIQLGADGVLATGLNGAYIVNEGSARSIFKSPVRYAYFDDNKNLLLLATYDGELINLEKKGSTWESYAVIDGIDEEINYIFSDRKDRIWLCGYNRLFWVALSRNLSVLDGGELAIPNAYRDPVAGVDDSNEGLIFMHNRGFFRESSGEIARDSLFSAASPMRFIAGDQVILVSDGKEWHYLTSADVKKVNLNLINVFDNVVSLDLNVEEEEMWAVTGDNLIYRINANASLTNPYAPYIREVISVNVPLPLERKLRIEEGASSLRFRFQQPEYSGLIRTEYRYRLEGLENEWSAWSESYHTLEWPYFPPGNYTLHVETRNIFGQTRSLEPFSFQVIPPYWKRPWFIAMEFSVFALLLVLSYVMNRRKSTQYTILNRILAFLTIILVIEFIQSVAENNFQTDTSPVLDFFIQVVIALCLLPVEGFIRKRIIREQHADKIESQLEMQVKKLRNSIQGTK